MCKERDMLKSQMIRLRNGHEMKGQSDSKIGEMCNKGGTSCVKKGIRCV